MTPDYTQYSLAELQEALGIVDERRYPENKAAIEVEIQARIDSGAYAEQEQAQKEQHEATAKKRIDLARKLKPYIAKYLIGTGAFVLVWNILQRPALDGAFQTAVFVIGMLYMLGTVISGLAIHMRKDWGTTLAIGLLCVQLVEIASTAFTIKVLSALGAYVSLSSNGDIGFNASFQPGVFVTAGIPQPFTIGVNLFVVWLIYLLVKAGEATEENQAGD